jgi:GNAT superfamily N-acetyltransferase
MYTHPTPTPLPVAPVRPAVPFLLPDGESLELRPVEPSDQASMAAFLESLSPRSRYLRFLTPLPRIEPTLVERLCRTDNDHHFAWAAVAEGGWAGVARFAHLPEDAGAAEVALTVGDRFQRRGLGRRLLEAVALVARSRGVDRLHFHMAGENHAMAGLLRTLGARARAGSGAVEAWLPTPAAIAGRMDEIALLRAAGGGPGFEWPSWPVALSTSG